MSETDQSVETGSNSKKGGDEAVAGKQWGSAAEFVITSLGFAVGLGNIWRFPNMVFSNGGGAFLIPYAICLIFIAIPLLLVEAAMGQYSGKGPIGVWSALPIFRGCGMGAIALQVMITVYYNAPISWAGFYLASSVMSPLPWTECGSWSTGNCSNEPIISSDFEYLNGNTDYPGLDNFDNAVNKPISSAEEYFYVRSLRITNGLDDWGTLAWDLLLSNFVIWIIIFIVICKGAESLGKIAYFTTLFPYVMLTILLGFMATLDGAGDGIHYYLAADPAKLTDIKVWRSAVSQVFFSTGCASGGVIQLASYNQFSNNIVRDTMLIPVLDGLTSFYAGFGVFAVLGFMAKQRQKNVADVVESGPGLIFVTYPEALSKMPGSAVWAFLFFFMICILGLSSQFPAVETLCGTFGDLLPWTQKSMYRRMAFRFVICMIAFGSGIFFYFGNGYFSYFLVDERVIGYPMILIGLVESVAISWVYGTDRLMADIEEMTGPWRRNWVKYIWTTCWKYVIPISLSLIFIIDVSTLEPLVVRGYEFSKPAMALSGILLSVPLICLGLYAIHSYCRACEGYTFLKKAAVSKQSYRLRAVRSSGVLNAGYSSRDDDNNSNLYARSTSGPSLGGLHFEPRSAKTECETAFNSIIKSGTTSQAETPEPALRDDYKLSSSSLSLSLDSSSSTSSEPTQQDYSLEKRGAEKNGRKVEVINVIRRKEPSFDRLGKIQHNDRNKMVLAGDLEFCI